MRAGPLLGGGQGAVRVHSPLSVGAQLRPKRLRLNVGIGVGVGVRLLLSRRPARWRHGDAGVVAVATALQRLEAVRARLDTRQRRGHDASLVARGRRRAGGGQHAIRSVQRLAPKLPTRLRSLVAPAIVPAGWPTVAPGRPTRIFGTDGSARERPRDRNCDCACEGLI